MTTLLDSFDAKKEIEKIEAFITEWFAKNGVAAKAVIGISGGKDSTVIARLLVDALGNERVIGVLMPDGEQADIGDALEVVKLLEIEYHIINIQAATSGLKAALQIEFEDRLSNDSLINIPPRVRMTTLYAVAQSISGGGRVINTCNRSEDFIGYSTKFGDSAGDVSPCGDYLVTEMIAIGDALGLPWHLVHKTPSDGLCGLSDEDRIGFSYAMLDEYIATGKCEDEEIKRKIDRMHAANIHKLEPLPTLRRVSCKKNA